jgi:hypothetical protein
MNINISENESTNNFQTKIKNNDSPRFTIKKFKKENSKKKRNTANNKLVYINEEKINRINLYINNIEKQKEIERKYEQYSNIMNQINLGLSNMKFNNQKQKNILKKLEKKLFKLFMNINKMKYINIKKRISLENYLEKNYNYKY